MPWQTVAIIPAATKEFALWTSVMPTNSQPLRIIAVGLDPGETVGVEVAGHRNDFEGMGVPIRWFQVGSDFFTVLPALPALPTAPTGTTRLYGRVFRTNRVPAIEIQRWVP